MRNSSRILLPLCLLASVVSTGQTDAHDLKITTRHASIGSEFTTTTYYSGENSRSEMQITSGNVKGHHRAIIRRKGAESIQVYDLDLDAHVYASYQTDLRGGVPGAGPRSFAGKPSGKTFVINVDVVDTGERQEMFGHIARHLITKEKRTGGPEIATAEIQKVKLTDGTSILKRCRCPNSRKGKLRHIWLRFLLVGVATVVLTRLKCIAPGRAQDFRSRKRLHGRAKVRSRAILQRLTP